MGFGQAFVVLPFILTIIIYFVFHLIKKKLTIFHTVIDIAFIAYCFWVIALLYFPLVFESDPYSFMIPFNLIPFYNIIPLHGGQLTGSMLFHTIVNVLGNILLFAPLSLYLCARFPDKRKRNLAIILTISFGAEVIQFMLALLAVNRFRVIDINDLLLNVSGGFFAWYFCQKRRKTKEEAK